VDSAESNEPRVSDRARDATAKLAEFASGLAFAKLPSEVVAYTRLLALDSIGCCLYGATLPWTRMLIDMVREEGGAPRATVFCGGFRTSVSQAVLANSSAGHAFESDDTHKPSFFHPGSICLPVSLACAEREGAKSGRDVITAMVAGYEVGTRVGMGATMGLFYRGWHPQGTTGTFVAAASAASMLKLSAEQAQDAIGIAATQASGLMSAQEGAMVKRMHSGRAAQSGVYGALLARRGYTGIRNVVEADFGGFLTTISDKLDPERVTQGLGSDWETLVVGFKPFSSVASIHAALYSLRQIMQENNLTAGDIAEIRAGIHKMTYVHCAWEYNAQDVTAAQMNLFFGLGAIAVDGEAFVEQYREDRLRDPRILEIVRRSKAYVDPEIEAMGPSARHAVRLAVVTRDGRTLRKEMMHSPGSPQHPLTPEQIVRKFTILARHALEPAQADRLATMTLELDRLSDVGPLIALLGEARPRAGR
jgi:2-methylcitrate dehydratase PrpD